MALFIHGSSEEWIKLSSSVAERSKMFKFGSLSRSGLSVSHGLQERMPLAYRVKIYFNIIYALVMHDIKNRFFGSGLGQIVMILWPFVHIVVLILIYTFAQRPAPYGSSLLQYTSVSIYPFICFSYVSRWIVLSALTNRSFLQYPIIKPIDIIVARSILEVISITIVGCLVAVTLLCCGDDPFPSDPMQALCAIIATIFFSTSFGLLNAVVTFVLPYWNIAFTLLIILSYVSSGILYVTADLPEKLRVFLSFNPVLQCIEWFRVAYYSDYPTIVLDKAYLLQISLYVLTFGLVLLRLLQRFL